MQVQIEISREFLEAFCKKWSIKEFSLFGSVVTEDFNAESDVDVLVRFESDVKWDLWHLVEMREDLMEVFGRQVDLIEEEGLRNPTRKEEILGTKVTIFE